MGDGLEGADGWARLRSEAELPREGSERYRLGFEISYAPDRCLLSAMVGKGCCSLRGLTNFSREYGDSYPTQQISCGELKRDGDASKGLGSFFQSRQPQAPAMEAVKLARGPRGLSRNIHQPGAAPGSGPGHIGGWETTKRIMPSLRPVQDLIRSAPGLKVCTAPRACASLPCGLSRSNQSSLSLRRTFTNSGFEAKGSRRRERGIALFGRLGGGWSRWMGRILVRKRHRGPGLV